MLALPSFVPFALPRPSWISGATTALSRLQLLTCGVGGWLKRRVSGLIVSFQNQLQTLWYGICRGCFYEYSLGDATLCSACFLHLSRTKDLQLNHCLLGGSLRFAIPDLNSSTILISTYWYPNIAVLSIHWDFLAEIPDNNYFDQIPASTSARGKVERVRSKWKYWEPAIGGPRITECLFLTIATQLFPASQQPPAQIPGADFIQRYALSKSYTNTRANLLKNVWRLIAHKGGWRPTLFQRANLKNIKLAD